MCKLKKVDLEVVEIALGRIPNSYEVITVADGHTFMVDYVTPYYVYLTEVEVVAEKAVI